MDYQNNFILIKLNTPLITQYPTWYYFIKASGYRDVKQMVIICLAV